MISIGRFLGGKAAHDWNSGILELVHGMFDATSDAAVNCDELASLSFRADMTDLATRVSPQSEPCAFAIVLENFAALLDRQKRTLERALRQQSTELKAMVKLAARSLNLFATEDNSSIDVLKTLQREADAVQSLRDIGQFKGRVKDALDHLHHNAEVRRKKYAEEIAELKRELEESRARLSDFRVDPTKDAVTGLPTRDEATKVLSFLAGKGALSFVIVINLQQLPGLNAKFGHQVGNLILQKYRDHLQRRIGDVGRLFRWGGKCLIVIYSTSHIAKENATEAVRILSGVANLDIETESRNLMIPLAPKWLCLGRTEALSGTQYIEQIDRFASDF